MKQYGPVPLILISLATKPKVVDVIRLTLGVKSKCNCRAAGGYFKQRPPAHSAAQLRGIVFIERAHTTVDARKRRASIISKNDVLTCLLDQQPVDKCLWLDL